jgi:formylmethanofuran dehydrogenase subunit C
MPLTLSWLGATRLPVEGEALRPELVAGLSAAEVARRRLPVGNRTAEVGELFRVGGEPADGQLVIEGDMRSLSGLGRGMSSGSLHIRGTAGPYLGAEMSGGSILLEGDAGDWAGAAMRGGELSIRGNAGDQLGSALPGARLGMREGVILVHGRIGNEAGRTLRRGLIAVRGDAGDDLGHDVIAGSIFVFGAVGRRPGAGLKRGTLALLGPQPTLLPTFRLACRYRPVFLTLYLRQLQAWGFPVPGDASGGLVDRYNGDLLAGGKGEILISS